VAGDLNRIEWDSIRAAYEVGGATPAEIAAVFSVRTVEVENRAEAEGWIAAGLARHVRIATEIELIRGDGATVTVDDIKNAASFNARLIRKHRELIGRSRDNVERLMARLESALSEEKASHLAFDQLVELAKEGARGTGTAFLRDKTVQSLRDALALSEHTGISKELVNTLKALIELERKAHYIPDAAPPTEDAPQMSEVTPENAAAVYSRMMG
jgi:hypothetical protein